MHAHKATHCHYTAQPAELPLLWFSSGKEAGKAISPYGQVHSTQVQNQLLVGSNSCVYPSAEHNAKGINTITEAVAVEALHYFKVNVDFQPKQGFIYKYKSLCWSQALT